MQYNSIILGDTKTIDIYWPENDPKHETKVKTIFDVVQLILDGDSSVGKNIKPLPARGNRFQVDLLPGHPRFSLFEDQLSQAWNEIPTGKAGGFRVSNWLRGYLEAVADNYDFVFVDVSPSLGAINRSVLLSTDFLSPHWAPTPSAF